MGETTGFLQWERQLPERRPVPVRLRDWKEVYEEFPADEVRTQAGRWMIAASRSVTRLPTRQSHS